MKRVLSFISNGIDLHTHVITQTHTHAHAYTRTHTRTRTRMHARTHAQPHARPPARTHARTHTHTHHIRSYFCLRVVYIRNDFIFSPSNSTQRQLLLHGLDILI